MANFLKIKYKDVTTKKVNVPLDSGNSNVYQINEPEKETEIVISSTEQFPFFLVDVETTATVNELSKTNGGQLYYIKIYELRGNNNANPNPIIDENMLSKYNTLNNTSYTNFTIYNSYSRSLTSGYRNNLAGKWGYYYLVGNIITDIECISTQCCVCVTTRAQEFLNMTYSMYGLGYSFRNSGCVSWTQLGYNGQNLARYPMVQYNALTHGKNFSYSGVDYGNCAVSWITLQSDFEINTFERFSNGTAIRNPLVPDEYNIPSGNVQIEHVYSAWTGTSAGATETTNRLTAFHTILTDNLSTAEQYTRSKWNYFRYLLGNQYRLHYDMNLNDNLIRAKLTSSEQICGDKEPLHNSSQHSAAKTTTITAEYALHIYTYRYDVDSDKYLFIKHTQTEYFDGVSNDVNFTQEVLTGLNNTPEYQYTSDKYNTNLYAEFYNILQLILYKHTKESLQYSSPGLKPVDKYEPYYSQPFPKAGNLTASEFEALKNTNLMYANTITISNCPSVFNDCNLKASTPYEEGELSISYIYDEPQKPEEPQDVDPQEPDDPTKNPTTPIKPDPETGKVPEPIPTEPPTPTNKLTFVDSLYKIYKMSRLEVDLLGSFLWNEDWVSLLKPLQTNPMENIISLKRSCFDLPTQENKVNILIGNVDTKVSAFPVYEQYSTVIGSFEFKGKYNSFLDFAPFTQYYMYLPFVGKKEIDPNLCLNHTLTISVVVDVTTLISRYVIKNEDNVVIAEYEFDSAMDLPMSGTDATQKAISIGTNLISTGAHVVGDAMVGNIAGAVAEGVSGLVSSVMSQVNTTTDGHPSANTSLLCDRTVYIEIHRPTYQYISTYAHTKGYPCSVARNVSSLSGFTTFDVSIDLSGVGATTTEIEQLKSLLVSGVYL